MNKGKTDGTKTADDVVFECNSDGETRQVGELVDIISTLVPDGRLTPAACAAAAKGDFVNFVAAATPGGIEAQEAAGQRALAEAKTVRLPKEVNSRPMGEPDRDGKTSNKKKYEAAGIKVIGDYDDLFFDVELPAGWKVVPTEHSMWSNLVDEKGRKRAGLFYKAAFYDRKADLSFNTRFAARCEPEDGYKTNISYDERRKMKVFGRVYDGDKVVYETAGEAPQDGWNEKRQQEHRMTEECSKWLSDQGYKDYRDPLKYWD
jgi:hypothetical protein